MKSRAIHRLLAALVIGLFSLPAVAQYTRDASAKSKIDEAINSHYLMMQLDKAEEVLTGTISACEDKCSPQTKAKAWMYVGIVRGSGKNDQAGAADAFAAAKGLDPAVTLDTELATPETKTTFDGTAGSSAAPAIAPVAVATSSAPPPGAAPPPPGVPGDMLCSPQGSPIQTGMPIPISCTSDAAVASGFIKFQEPGGTDWKKVNLFENAGQWQAEIPCTYTAKAGELKLYIGVKDANGEFVDQFGSKKEPAVLTLSETGVAPAYPGQAPVTRCMDSSSDCPPDFPGCEAAGKEAVCGDLDWGAACNNSSQCKCGLLCEEGQCATAPTCTADAECETGACVDGYCSAVSTGDKEAGPYKKHWLSLDVGMDFMPLGGDNLCGANEGFKESYGIYCYNLAGESVAPEGVNIKSGIGPGQLRIKLGYDFAVLPVLQLGARVGIALLNTHPRAVGEVGFLPLHAEGRATWAILGLSKAGIRPSLYVAGGIGEVNAKLVAADTRVYKLAGRMFAAPGLKLEYMFSPQMGIGLDTQLALLFPEGGIAIALHPALNFTYGL